MMKIKNTKLDTGMRIELMPLSALTAMAHQRNPKNHNLESIIASFKRFGFKAAPTIDETTQIMVAGHGRCEALAKMRNQLELPPEGVHLDGIEWLVPVVRGISFKSERERDAYLIADNQQVIAGGWNFDVLTELIGELEGSLDGLGFEQTDLDALICQLVVEPLVSPVESVGPGEREGYKPPEEDEIPEPPKVPITKPGDVWQLGDHVLFCGDSRGDIAHLFAGGKAAIAVTSPPYASQRKYDETTGFKPIAPDDYIEWFEAVQRNVRSVLADDGSWFLNIKAHCEDGQRHLYVNDLVAAHVREWGWRFVDEFCWIKPGFPGENLGRFKNGWEPIFHFTRSGGHKHRPDAVSMPSESCIAYEPSRRHSMSGVGWVEKDSPKNVAGLARPSNVLKLPAGKTDSDMKHSAAFPIALPSFFISAFSDPGDTIFEPFCGSGTTLIAAEKLGRRCVGVEISPAYCDVIVERWERVSGGNAQRLETPNCLTHVR